jgi:hypothetical protein
MVLSPVILHDGTEGDQSQVSKVDGKLKKRFSTKTNIMML